MLSYTPLQTGIAYLALSVPLFLTALAARRLVGPWSPAAALSVGLSIAVAGRLWLCAVPANGSYVRDLLPGLVTVGIGIGLTLIPLTLLAVNGTPRRSAGVVTGLLSTSQQVGGALGVAAVSSIAAYAQRHAAGGSSPGALPVGAYTGGFALTAAMAGLALSITVVRLRGPSDRREH